MILNDPALRSHILPYLTVRELIKLRQVSTNLRQWIRSPSIEKQSLIRCLKQCYGLYDFAYEAKSHKWRCHHPPEVPTWLDLEMILSLEADQIESEYLDEFSLGTAEFNRVSLPGSKENKLLLKYLNIDWVRGEAYSPCPSLFGYEWFERCEVYKLGRDASLGEVQSMIESIEVDQQKLNHLDSSAGDPFVPCKIPEVDLPIFLKPDPTSLKHLHIKHDTDKFTELLKETPYDAWGVRGTNAAATTDGKRLYVPREAAIPFYIRVALEDAALVKRLIDVDDIELTPTRFLRKYGVLHFRRDDYHYDYPQWPLPDRVAEEAISQLLATSLLENTRIFELPPDGFWDIDTPMGMSNTLSTSTLAEWLRDMEEDWCWWDHCCDSLADHYRYHLSQLMTSIMRHPSAAPFDASVDQGLSQQLRIPVKRDGDHESFWIFLGTVHHDRAVCCYHNRSYHFFLTSQGLVILYADLKRARSLAG